MPLLERGEGPLGARGPAQQLPRRLERPQVRRGRKHRAEPLERQAAAAAVAAAAAAAAAAGGSKLASSPSLKAPSPRSSANASAPRCTIAEDKPSPPPPETPPRRGQHLAQRVEGLERHPLVAAVAPPVAAVAFADVGVGGDEGEDVSE